MYKVFVNRKIVKFEITDQAKAFCEQVFKKTGIVLAIEQM